MTSCTDAVALDLFGGGSGPIHYTDFQCTGNETLIIDCAANEVPGQRCIHVEDAGVRCAIGEQIISDYTHTSFIHAEPQCNETDIRLVNGQTSYDGRVELCLYGQWGSVCDDRWDTRIYCVCYVRF